jgi:hypothetical protein
VVQEHARRLAAAVALEHAMAPVLEPERVLLALKKLLVVVLLVDELL